MRNEDNPLLKKLYDQIDQNTIFGSERKLYKDIINDDISLERSIEIVNFLQSPQTAMLAHIKDRDRWLYRHRTMEASKVYWEYGDVFKKFNIEICERA